MFLAAITSIMKIIIKKSPVYDYLKNDFDFEFLNRTKQGFVFDYKNWVYNNIEMIEQKIIENLCDKNLHLHIEDSRKLKIVKTRINALRIWKLYVLSNYLESINNL